jgi:hypothetical protein
MTDAAYKAFHAPHLLSGVERPEEDPRVETGPHALGMLYGPPGANAQALMPAYDFAGIGQHLDRLRAKLREDYPELSFERIRVAGDASAVAIREARKPAETKVRERRVEYDDGFARACKMGLTMGGLAGYDKYTEFNEGSYDAGELDFTVGDRPVFATGEAERLEEQAARARLQKELTDAGWPLDEAAVEAGYHAETVARLRQAMQARTARQEKEFRGDRGGGVVEQ